MLEAFLIIVGVLGAIMYGIGMAKEDMKQGKIGLILILLCFVIMAVAFLPVLLIQIAMVIIIMLAIGNALYWA
jgi:hypothetical protein